MKVTSRRKRLSVAAGKISFSSFISLEEEKTMRKLGKPFNSNSAIY